MADSLPLPLDEILFDQEEVAIVVLSLENVIVGWNRGAERIFGYREDEAIGRPGTLIFTERDVSKHVPERELSDALATGQAEDSRWHLRRDGGVRYVSGVTQKIAVDSRPVGFVKIVRDYTRDKEQERRVSAIAAATRVLAEEREIATAGPRFLEALCNALFWDAGAIWLPADGETLRCAAAWARPASAADGLDRALRQEWSFERGQASVGSVWTSASPLWVSDLAEAGLFARAPLLTKHELRTAFLFPILHASHAIGVCELFTFESRERDPEFVTASATLGLLLGYFAERERSDTESLRQAKAREHLLSVVSHDLRAPLTAIRGWSQLLTHSDADATVAQAARTIEDAAKVLQTLVDDLVDFARVANAQLRIEREIVDIPAVVAAAVDAILPHARNAGIDLELHAAIERCAVVGDTQRLRQVFDNLLTNAIKFSNPGDRVTVTVDRKAPTTVSVEVADTGRGIAADFLPTIFDRYKSSPAPGSGLGLGLTIVAEIVRLHEGTETAHSEGPGHGSRFVVSLPAEITSAAAGARTS